MISPQTYLVITPFFPSNNSFVGSYVFDQLNQLREQTSFNIEVVKVVSIFSTDNDYHFKGFDVKVFKVVDLPYFIFPGIFNWLNKLRFISFLSKRKIKDIKFSHSHVTYPSLYIVEGLNCIKIVQHHGLDVLQLLNGRSKLIRKIQKYFLIRNSIKHINCANLNVGVSNLVLQKFGDYKKYITTQEYTLYNGVDRSKFFEYKTIENKIFTIGCIANFWETKGQHILIKSVQSLLEKGELIRLRFIGSGRTLSSCKSYVVDNNLSEHISFETEIPHDDLNHFYNNIDLFVLPSYYEALGCVYLESWAANTPFIAVKGQGISELINSEDQMLSEANDCMDLTKKIHYFMNNEFVLPTIKNLDIKNTISQFLSLDIFTSYD